MRRAGLGGPPGDVEQGCDVQVGKELALGCVVGTSKVKERKDFNWATLGSRGKGQPGNIDQLALWGFQVGGSLSGFQVES